jgi:hypothetical protein
MGLVNVSSLHDTLHVLVALREQHAVGRIRDHT